MNKDEKKTAPTAEEMEAAKQLAKERAWALTKKVGLHAAVAIGGALAGAFGYKVYRNRNLHGGNAAGGSSIGMNG